ncbi:MAG: HEAT repeat domain-containing protein [Anaerolineales bacterium]|jgi:HEAT repeat protein
MITSEEEAMRILHDDTEGIARREEAASYLEENPSVTGIDGLVAGMDDDDPGVRWATSNALAELGEAALPAVLQALIQGYNSRMRDSAYHFLRGNSSPWVRMHAETVRQALRSVAPEVTAPKAAAELLAEFKAHRL